MCALFYENQLGIKKSGISFVYLFCPKFRVPYHSNHVIPHHAICPNTLNYYGKFTSPVGTQHNYIDFSSQTKPKNLDLSYRLD